MDEIHMDNGDRSTHACEELDMFIQRHLLRVTMRCYV